MKWTYLSSSVLPFGVIGLTSDEDQQENSLRLPGYNISSLKAECGGQRNLIDREGRFACVLGCSDDEPSLLEALKPWNDLEERGLDGSLWKYMCSQAKTYTQAYLATYRAGRLFWKCCSQGADACDPSEIQVNGVRASDIEILLQVVLEVAQASGLPDMDFCFNTGDQPFTYRHQWPPVPQFHWVSSPTYWGIPMPSPFHLKALVVGRLGNMQERLSKLHWPWERRNNRLFWRGGLSGPDNIITAGLEAMPRLQLHRLAKAHPDLFDVKFSGFDTEMEVALGSDSKGKHWKRIKKELNISQRNHVDFSTELPRKKYVINVSAVLSSWRLVELLASGALIFLQADADKEVLRDWLVPWEHFVPVSYELSDLLPKLQWLREHDDEAQKIASRGYQRFVERARQEDVHCYVWRALRAVSRIAGPGIHNLREFQEFKLRKKLRAPGRGALVADVDAGAADVLARASEL